MCEAFCGAAVIDRVSKLRISILALGIQHLQAGRTNDYYAGGEAKSTRRWRAGRFSACLHGVSHMARRALLYIVIPDLGDLVIQHFVIFLESLIAQVVCAAVVARTGFIQRQSLHAVACAG